jgi:hypothetical protein
MKVRRNSCVKIKSPYWTFLMIFLSSLKTFHFPYVQKSSLKRMSRDGKPHGFRVKSAGFHSSIVISVGSIGAPKRLPLSHFIIGKTHI